MPLFVFNRTEHHHHHYPNANGPSLALEALVRSMGSQLNHLTGKIDSMRSEVQALVTEVTNLKTTKEASDRAWDVMVSQLDEAKNRAAALEQQVKAGGVDPEDIAALTSAIGDIHQVAVNMKGAVPANTPDAAPAGGQQG